MKYLIPRSAGSLAGAITLGSLLAAFSSVAQASDYYYECRTADGRFVLHDGELQATGSERRIPYDTLGKTVLRKTAGFCIDRRQGGRQRFRHGAETYVLHIAFRHEGQRVETHALCELASDGLPAAYSCDRRVTTLDWRISAAVPPEDRGDETDRGGRDDDRPGDALARHRADGFTAGSAWTHNESNVRILARGADRRIVYELPREGLAVRGVKPGDIVFEGQRRDAFYAGEAYIYTARCGRVGYRVSGRVNPNETRLVLTGERPRLNERCRATGSRPDRLVFRLAR